MDMRPIVDSVQSSSLSVVNSYLHGAMHDGTQSRLHRTIRIAQADQRWLQVLSICFASLGCRSWTYREGQRSVWVIESAYRLTPLRCGTPIETAAFIRGFFDAEGGIPRSGHARFYIQLAQKNRQRLNDVRKYLDELQIRAGRLHNPSVSVDPDYWRFYIRSCSWRRFAAVVSSWHPAKRHIFNERFPDLE